MAEGSLKRKGIVAAVCAVAIAAIGIGLRARSDHQVAQWTEEQAMPSVAIIRPKAADGDVPLVLPGNVQADNSAAIYARTNGYVRKWFVDIGDGVKQGQLLALIDAPEVDQQLAAAEADYQTALANQQLARSTAARWSNLLAKDAVSRQETDEKAGDLAAKTAIANAGRANVQRLRALQGFTRLTAPFAGTVTSRSTQIGALVSAGSAAATPLFTISDVSSMRIYVRVPQNYSAQVHTGMHASLILPEYPGRAFDATLSRTAGAVDAQSGAVLVQLTASNRDGALKPGAYAQVRFPLRTTEGAVQIPVSALIVGADGPRVAVLKPGNRAEIRPVTVVRDTGANVEVGAGLKSSDRVIDSPPDSLAGGDVVRVVGGADARK